MPKIFRKSTGYRRTLFRCTNHASCLFGRIIGIIARVMKKDYLIRLNYVVNLANYTYSSFHTIFEKLERVAWAQQFKNFPGYKDLQLNEGECLQKDRQT